MESQLIQQLARLAMESELAIELDWESFGVDKEQIFTTMAEKVYEQLESVPEEQRAIVAMATMTRLLVENFVLNKLTKDKNE